MATGYKFPIQNYDDTVGDQPAVTVVVTTTVRQASYTVPSDFGSLAYVAAIGGGGSGAVVSQLADAPGGGGGAYAQTTGLSLTPGQTIYFRVGAGGVVTGNVAAEDSWINISANSAPANTSQGCLAKGGRTANVTSAGAGAFGGQASSCIGTLVYSGGAGGISDSGSNGGGGGGGGAAGPSGAGASGGNGDNTSNMGGGGGGSNGGSVGGSATSTVPGAGGYGLNAIGSGGIAATSSVAAAPGQAGTGAGGGGGHTNSSTVCDGGAGATGSIWTVNGLTYGSGGGGGGAGDATGTTAGTGGSGGLYGGGGGGGEDPAGSLGAQGLVIFAYYKTLGPTTTVDMEDMFVKQDYFLDSNLYGWGQNSNGQLGDGTVVGKSTPIQIGQQATWKQVEAGYTYALGLETDGTLWAWGQNLYGNFGDGTVVNKSSPIQIGKNTDWKYIYSSGPSSFAIKNDGTLWGWGLNTNGRLGTGNVTDYSSPVQVGTGTNWKIVKSSDDGTTLALKTDGTLWAWGYNQAGTIGNGTTIYYSSPIQIGSMKDWKSIGVKSGASHAIKNDGSLWAWGANGGVGILGNSQAFGNYSSPIQIGSLYNWKSLTSNGSFVAATKNDGTLWVWGGNSYGQLGLGNTINRSSPVQVGTLTNWKSVEAAKGDGDTLFAIKTDGTLWMCGIGDNFVLGIGTQTAYSSPIQLGTATNWKQVTGFSSSFTMAISSPDLP